MIRIRFPSPSELSNDSWFEQMELSLFHARKAYQKFVRAIPEEKREDVSIMFSYPEMEKNEKFKELLDNEEIDYDDSQEVELTIDY